MDTNQYLIKFKNEQEHAMYAGIRKLAATMSYASDTNVSVRSLALRAMQEFVERNEAIENLKCDERRMLMELDD